MADPHNDHKTFTGADLERLKPVFDAIFTKRQELNAVLIHACRRAFVPPAGQSWSEGDMLAHYMMGAIPRNAIECMDLCPTDTRSAPMLLRDLADLYEDLAKLASVEPAKIWEPKKQ